MINEIARLNIVNIEVGDYVRNKYGIAKVIDIENNNGIDILVFDKPICFLVNKKTGEIKDDRSFNRLAIIDGIDVSKIKSSPDITDLIEVGDYVNGGRVYKIKLPYIIVDDSEFSEDGAYLKEEDIKSIVTKEQFERMEYRIGE